MTNKEKKAIDKIDFIIGQLKADKVIIEKLGIKRLQYTAHYTCMQYDIEELIDMIKEG